jgi:hypothetical protein
MTTAKHHVHSSIRPLARSLDKRFIANALIDADYYPRSRLRFTFSEPGNGRRPQDTAPFVDINLFLR